MTVLVAGEGKAPAGPQDADVSEGSVTCYLLPTFIPFYSYVRFLMKTFA